MKKLKKFNEEFDHTPLSLDNFREVYDSPPHHRSKCVMYNEETGELIGTGASFDFVVKKYINNGYVPIGWVRGMNLAFNKL